MISYDLAKELKDAGFPQQGGRDVAPIIFSEDLKFTSDTMPEAALYYPTLEELIEACGEGFRDLEKDKDMGWTCYGEIGPQEGDGDYVHGSTPHRSRSHVILSSKWQRETDIRVGREMN